MQFTAGDQVLVRSLGKGIVREVRRGGRCLVEIKGRSLLVDEHQLSYVESPKVRGRPRASRPADADLPATHGSTSIDLHGMTTDEAVTALADFLNAALLAGSPEVRVIHGRSGGRIKAVVHRHLEALPSVRAFRLDPGNPGVTVVSL